MSNKLVVKCMVMISWVTNWMILLTGDGIGCVPGFGHMVSTCWLCSWFWTYGKLLFGCVPGFGHMVSTSRLCSWFWTYGKYLLIMLLVLDMHGKCFMIPILWITHAFMILIGLQLWTIMLGMSG